MECRKGPGICTTGEGSGMKHIHEYKMESEAEFQMHGVKKGDVVVVHRGDYGKEESLVWKGKEESLVCVITLCENTSCIDCVLCGLWCYHYKGMVKPGISFAFVPLENAVE